VSELTYTLVSDGSSDAGLMPILEWLLRQNGVACAIQGEWAEFRHLRQPPRELPERLRWAVDLYPCELLFVHRDAERESYDLRCREIEGAVGVAFGDGQRPCVAVVPVRMTEAWLLFDEKAIRGAAGNPAGRMGLPLPELARCEDLPDPKQDLDDALRAASGLNARRQATLHVRRFRRRVSAFTADFSPLRALRAFRALEETVGQAVQRNGWHRR
jgi:hypothetical protein